MIRPLLVLTSLLLVIIVGFAGLFVYAWGIEVHPAVCPLDVDQAGMRILLEGEVLSIRDIQGKATVITLATCEDDLAYFGSEQLGVLPGDVITAQGTIAVSDFGIQVEIARPQDIHKVEAGQGRFTVAEVLQAPASFARAGPIMVLGAVRAEQSTIWLTDLEDDDLHLRIAGPGTDALWIAWQNGTLVEDPRSAGYLLKTTGYTDLSVDDVVVYDSSLVGLEFKVAGRYSSEESGLWGEEAFLPVTPLLDRADGTVALTGLLYSDDRDALVFSVYEGNELAISQLLDRPEAYQGVLVAIRGTLAWQLPRYELSDLGDPGSTLAVGGVDCWLGQGPMSLTGSLEYEGAGDRWLFSGLSPLNFTIGYLAFPEFFAEVVGIPIDVYAWAPGPANGSRLADVTFADGANEGCPGSVSVDDSSTLPLQGPPPPPGPILLRVLPVMQDGLPTLIRLDPYTDRPMG